MTGQFLLTGGTGTLGRLVEPLLRQAGAPVRILSRRERAGRPDVVVGDLTTGAGLEAALAGVATVVHCAGTAKGDDDKARRLVRAAVGAGVTRLVRWTRRRPRRPSRRSGVRPKAVVRPPA